MWKRIAYWLLGVLLLQFAIQQTCNWAASRIASFQSAEVRRAAESAMGPDSTIEEAQQWLRLTGFESTPPDFDFSKGYSRRSTSAGTTELLVTVWGQRQIVPQNWFIEPRWLEVEFLFDQDSTFQRVETNVWPWSLNFHTEAD
jgi:hypothetical protein